MSLYQFLKAKLFILLLIGLLMGFYTLAHQIYKNKEIASYENFYKNEEEIALDVLKPLMNEPIPEVNLNQERIKVLVIEGGGIKGFFPVVILNYLEKKTGKPISELYDVMAGTSIGSVIASLLSTPENGKPKYSTDDLLKNLPSLLSKSLEPSWKQIILSGLGLLTPVINNQKFINILQSSYGNIPFSKARNHLVLYGYNFSTTTYTAFHNRGSSLKIANPLLYQLIGATTAYFGIMPPNKILLNPSRAPEFIGDAGIVTPNPVESTMIDLIKMYPGKKFMITYIILNSKSMPAEIDFPFFSGSINSEKIIYPLVHTSNNQLIRDSMKFISSVYRFDLLNEIGLEQNSEWNNIDSFDFSDQNYAKVFEFSKLITQKNKDELDSIAEELLKD